MMRGRKAKPTAIKTLQGNPGKRKLSPNEPKPKIADAPPDPPDWLDVVGTKTWLRMRDVLFPMKLLTLADYEALSLYSDIYSQWWKSRKTLNQKGQSYVLLDKDGNVISYKPFPQVGNYSKLAGMMMKILIEFGMTPSSRARIGLGNKDEKPTEPLDNFLAGNTWGNDNVTGEA